MRTRFAVWALTLLLLMPLAAGAATLSYSYGTTYSSYNARDLIITATEGGATVWEMRVRVPTSGQTNTTHNYYAAGQIVSFKDVQHGGTAFDYSAEAVANASFGLFDFGGCSDSGISGANATFADTQTAGYYEFTKTTTSLFHMGSVNDPNNVVTTVLTVRINAPTVSGNGHTTSISAGLRLTNNQATTLNLWYSAYCAGQWAMHLNAGTSTGTFVNADSATVKPNVHNTAGTDDHAVYAVSDWYGSKVTTIDGTLVQAVVKNNQAARDRNMRPGMTFAISAPDMATYYSDLANTMYGSTVQTTSGSNYYVNALLRQPGPFGQGVTLAPAASVTMNFAAEIIAPGGQPPVANAGADQIVHDTDRSGDQLVTLDGSASTDADGSIVSYVWKNGETQIATGATPQVLLAAGVHTLTLTVTDDDNLTDSDTVVVTVNAPPIAMAGNDQTVIDSLGNGSVSVALSAAGSTDADGTIVSYVWQDNGVQVATGSAAQVSLAVGEHTMTLIVTDNLGGTDSDTCTVVVNQVHTAGTMVNAPRNDCSASSSSHDYNTSTMYLPYSNDSQQTFLRFRTAIPKGATIVGAYLKVMSNGQAGNTSSSVARVRVLDSDSCDNFTANPYALDVMAGSLDWTLPGTWTEIGRAHV